MTVKTKLKSFRSPKSATDISAIPIFAHHCAENSYRAEEEDAADISRTNIIGRFIPAINPVHRESDGKL